MGAAAGPLLSGAGSGSLWTHALRSVVLRHGLPDAKQTSALVCLWKLNVGRSVVHLQQLRAFCEVADGLSFTQAARNLHYAQSTITTQIRNLEESVGADLFDRSGRQVALTPAGLRLLPYARRIIQLTETARRDTVAASRAHQRQQHRRRPAQHV